MDSSSQVKQIATQILAAMMSNPHIYPNVSDEAARGEREQLLMTIAIEMAVDLIAKAEQRSP